MSGHCTEWDGLFRNDGDDTKETESDMEKNSSLCQIRGRNMQIRNHKCGGFIY